MVIEDLCVLLSRVFTVRSFCQDGCEYVKVRLGEAHCRVKAVHVWPYVNFSCHTWLERWQLKCSTLIHLARRVLKGERYFAIRFVSLLEYTCRVYTVFQRRCWSLFGREGNFPCRWIMRRCRALQTFWHWNTNATISQTTFHWWDYHWTYSQYRFPKYLTLAFLLVSQKRTYRVSDMEYLCLASRMYLVYWSRVSLPFEENSQNFQKYLHPLSFILPVTIERKFLFPIFI